MVSLYWLQAASLYLWLSNQFPREFFPDIAEATAAAEAVASELSTALDASAAKNVDGTNELAADEEWLSVDNRRKGLHGSSKNSRSKHASRQLHGRFQRMLGKPHLRKDVHELAVH